MYNLVGYELCQGYHNNTRRYKLPSLAFTLSRNDLIFIRNRTIKWPLAQYRRHKALRERKDSR